ncbi:non-homologous end-joining DNA ligase [Paenibacillus urinalis]|uniref:Non-homologous end-joining DNA ligase n=1 Tax=Paenibacillus urinalis TaxID=521520 RepID=A0ABY7XCD2_9BACL|nr:MULTISPECIES: non-homologous end-joining DNA ligase [Paenibacillus]WDH95264.1 non-homologous end-joining DNA ligase [Paenibacillus urinalis]WDI03458.1 non-homologous end-joining DNA ligase [Paenibacillus urinalis]GAK41092.1 DNA polymerase LigD, polymerase domain-containing protein [Paenibacillus sp. TCA20]
MPRSIKGTIQIEGQDITITNPDKPLWPEAGVTKAMYLQKLAELSPYLLKYCRNRLLTTIRYPHGIHGEFFYQKNAPEPLPPYVKTAVHEGINYIVMEDLPVLLWLGNLAALEFHPSLHYAGSKLPCEWMIDLDPSLPEEPRIMEAAHIVGQTLSSLGIQSVPKTSGATGVQIIVPIQSGITFEELRTLGHFVGMYVCQKHPDLFTLERLKKDRGNKIYFDYLQHYGGKTLAAPYTPRAREHASVSTPLLWDEVAADVRPKDFHLLNIGARLAEKGDLLSALPPQPLENVLKHLKNKK